MDPQNMGQGVNGVTTMLNSGNDPFASLAMHATELMVPWIVVLLSAMAAPYHGAI